MSMIFILLALAFLLFFMEIFIPGGILAVVGFVLIGIAAFLAGKDFGIVYAALVLLTSSVLAVLLFFLEVRFLSSGPLARYFMNRDTIDSVANKPIADDLLGKQGITLTKLTPSGKVQIDGVTYEAATTGSALDEGITVEVVRKEAFRIVIKPV